MATELAKAYVQIIPSAKGIKGTLTKSLGGEAGSAGESAGKSAGTSFGGKFATAVKGVIAAAGIAEALKTVISEGAAIEQSIGGIETLFGAGGQSIKDFAQKAGKSISEVAEQYNMLENAQELALGNAADAYKTAGLSANEYMETVTSFAAALKSSTGNELEAAKAADKAVIAMADNANKMGTDMTSIQNAYQGFSKQNYTMLDNLKLGYGGNKTEMERLLKDAEKLTGIKYDIDNLSDVYSAIQVIQDELGITGTTAKEASETLSGSMNSMKAAFSNLLGNLALGKDIGPSLTALSETVFIFLQNNLLPMIGKIISQLPTILIGGLSMLTKLIRSTIENNGEDIIQGGAELITELAEGIGYAIPVILDVVWELVDMLENAFINGDWVGVAGNIINEFIDGFARGKEEGFGDVGIIDTILEGMTVKLPQILNKGIEIVTELTDGIFKSLPEIITVAGEIIEALVSYWLDSSATIWAAGADVIINLASGLIDNAPAILAALAKTLVSLVFSIGQKLPEFYQSGFEIITKLAIGLIEAIPKLMDKIPVVIESIKNAFIGYDWENIGKNIIEGVISGIKNMVGEIAEAAKEVAGNILTSVKSMLGIHSPSKVFEEEVGKMIDLGVASGIKKNTVAIFDSAKEINSTIDLIDADFGVPTNNIGATLDYERMVRSVATGIIQSGITETVRKSIKENGNSTINIEGREWMRIQKTFT